VSKFKDEAFTDQEPAEAFDPDPEYNNPDTHGLGIAHLAEALSSAQGEIEDAHKDKSGYGYKYADLSQVLSIARPVLSKHGLAVTQLLGGAGDRVSITTILMHKSGELISTRSSMPVHISKGMSHAQAVGSISTYLRRYALSAIVGITQADTDASSNTETDLDKLYNNEPPAKIPKTSAGFQKPLPDPKIIKALMACEDMGTLAEMWGKLDKSQHKLYAEVKEQRKAELQADESEQQQAKL